MARVASVLLDQVVQQAAQADDELWCAESDLLLEQTAQSMATGPNVQLAEIAGAGHAPALMDPAQIALVAAFLAQ